KNIDVKRLDQIAELDEHAAGVFLLKSIPGIDLHDHPVDLPRLERGGLRGGRTERGDGESLIPPALATRQFLREPIGQTAARRDADLFSLELGDCFRSIV